MRGKKTDWENYRQLKKGETVKEGDEFFLSSKDGWMPVVHGIGRMVPDPRYSSHTIYRRMISASRHNFTFLAISRGQLCEQFIIEHADLMDWELVCVNMKLSEYSDSFFEMFVHDINWYHIVECNKSITTEFALKYHEEIGSKRTYKDGELHSHDGLPAIVYPCGQMYWYKDGEHHRGGDMPAFVNPSYGLYMWYKNGVLHRDEGPAVIYMRENKREEYWRNGVQGTILNYETLE